MRRRSQSGFIKLLLVIIIALLVLSYFGFSLREVVNSPAGQDNLSFLRELGTKIWEFLGRFWDTYLADKATQVSDWLKANFGRIKTVIPLPD